MKSTIAIASAAALIGTASALELTLDPQFLKTVASNPTHYGDPAGGCDSDEKSVQVQGLSGDFCSPACTGTFQNKCPSDVPTGVTAQPQCALQDAGSGAKYCALICTPGADDGACGTGSCQAISGVGICTYGSSEFNLYMQEHGHKFEAEEYTMRLAVYNANVKKIEEHNAANKGWTMKMNMFGHLTAEEFSSMYTGLKMPEPDTSVERNVFENNATAPNPTDWDWTDHGAVTPVKNQGSCGSCWSFSTTGSLEGAYFLKNNELVSFSEQNLVSCDTVDSGCNGGLMDNAFNWIEKNGGLCKEDDYPYNSGAGVRGKCTEKKCTIVKNSAPTSIVDVSPQPQVKPATVDAMEAAVSKTPVSVAIEADQSSFQFYSSGVMTSECGTQLDHGVLVVGYGTDSGTDYWKIKNSWGPTWGVDGFIKIEKGNSQKGGQCGVLLAASYPVL